jgi:hypothetical protein
MRSRMNAVLMLAASFTLFIAGGSAKSVQTSGYQSPTAVLTDGTGLMCIPDSPCGRADKTSFRSSLLAAGPGPMCIPDAPCVYDFGVLASRARFRPGVLMAAGPGPMCIPGAPCAYNSAVLANSIAFSTRSLAY